MARSVGGVSEGNRGINRRICGQFRFITCFETFFLFILAFPNAALGAEPCYGLESAAVIERRDCFPCKTGRDCSYTSGLGCFPNLAENGTENGCVCHAFYGIGSRHGDDECETYALPGVTAVHIIILLPLTCLHMYSVATAVRGLRALRYRAAEKRSRVQTLWLCGLAAFSMIFANLGIVCTAFGVDPDMWFVNNAFGPVVGIALAMAATGTLNVCAVWIDTVASSINLRRAGGRNLSRVKVAVQITAITFAVTNVALIVQEKSNAASIVLLFYNLLVFTTYLYGGCRLSKLIVAASEESPARGGHENKTVAEFDAASKRILWCTRVIVAGCGIYSVAAIIFVALFWVDWERTNAGRAVMFSAMLAGFAINNAAVVKYLTPKVEWQYCCSTANSFSPSQKSMTASSTASSISVTAPSRSSGTAAAAEMTSFKFTREPQPGV